MILVIWFRSLLKSYSLVHELVCIIFALLPLTSGCVVVCAGSDASTGHSQITANPEGTQLNVSENIELKRRDPLKRAIGGKEIQRFFVTLTSGESASIVVQWQGIDLDVTVLRPSGEALYKYPIAVRASGSLPVLVLSELAGIYTLEVRTSDGSQTGGKYEVTLEDLRPATAADQTRFATLTLVIEAERARDRPLAIEKFLRAITLWQNVQDKVGEAYTSQKLGRLYMQANDSKSATKFYDAAIQLRRELGNQQQLGYTLREVAADYMNFNPPDLSIGEEDARERALGYFEEAAEIFRQTGNLRGEGYALFDLGLAHSRIGDTKKALEAYDRALVLMRNIQDSLGEARTLNGIGGVYSIRGDQGAALEHFEASFSIFEKLGDRSRQALSKNNQGLAYHNWGNFQKAREYYEEALAIVESLSDTNDPARCKNVSAQQARVCNLEASVVDNLSELDNSFDQPEAAIEKLKRSEPIRRDLNFRQELGSTIARKAYSFFLLSKHEPLKAKEHLSRALAACQEALSFQSGRSDWAGRALTLTYRGMVEAALGEFYFKINRSEEAHDHLTESLTSYREALDLQRKTGERRAQTVTIDSQGQVYELMGQPATALEYYAEALQIWRAIKDEDGETITLYNSALAERTRGNLSEAQQYITNALRLIEARRGNLSSHQLRASYFANKRNYYELDADLKMQLSKAQNESGYVKAGLEASEKAHARILLDSLAEAGLSHDFNTDLNRIGDPRLVDLVKQKLVLQSSLSAKAQFRTKLLSGKHTNEQVAGIDRAIEEIKNKYDQLDSEIRTVSPHYVALTKPEPLNVEQIQQQLDADTLLLQYLLGEKRSYVWVVSQNSVRGFELSGRDHIETLARGVTEALTERNREVKNETGLQTKQRLDRADKEFADASAALSKSVLEPVASFLGKKRLVVVADGALQLVPFAALPTTLSSTVSADASSKVTASVKLAASPTRLVDQYEIISLPSASVLALHRRELANRKPAPYAVAVLADPVFQQTDVRLAGASKTRKSSSEIAKKGQGGEVAPKQGVPGASTSIPNSSGSAASSNETSPLAKALRDVGIDGSLRRLLWSAREAKAIAELVSRNQLFSAIGFKASRETATSAELSKYRIIHFATHGVMDLDHPELSGIVLSMFDEKGHTQDGYLRLHEIYNLNLPAELVVLSACQTGVGKQIKGEGLIALTRGFMYAGAKSIVASLWQVDDAATAELMGEFYKQMLTNKGKPAAALRAAQLEIANRKHRNSPYYWAGFFLQGEWN